MKRLILMLTCLCGLVVFIGRVNAQDTAEAEKPITIDFVLKDIHVIMHYLQVKSGWTIQVDSAVNVRITCLATFTNWAEMLRTICKDHNLTFDVDEETKTIMVHPGEGRYARFLEVTFSEETTSVHACFSRVTVSDALIAVCRKCDVHGFLKPVSDGANGFKTGPFAYGERAASLYTEDMSLDEVFLELARQGDLKYEWREAGELGEGAYFEPIPVK